MKIMKAKIIWFPNFLTSVTEDKLSKNKNWKWKNNHYEKIKKDMINFGLYFPGVIMKDEIHSGHYRLKIAKEIGYDGIEMYRVNNYADVNFLSRFNELSYKFLIKTRKLKIKMKPISEFL
jgi:hypothetical protein